MANVTNIYKKTLLDYGATAGTANKYRCMLLTACYAFPLAGASLDDDNVTAFLASTPNEATVGGYARQTLASGGTTGPDDTNDRAAMQFGKATFTSLATGETIVAAAIIWVSTPGAPNDANDYVAMAYDLTDTPTNGGNIEVRWNGTDGTGDALYLS